MLCARSPALENLSVDRWPVLGVAVHTTHHSGQDKKTGGSVHVYWALAQKPQSQQQNSRYLVHDLFGKEPAHHHGASACHRISVLHTADTHRVAGNHWHTAIQEGKGPQMDKLNGTKFFPYIQVKSLRHKAFKVLNSPSCRFCSL